MVNLSNLEEIFDDFVVDDNEIRAFICKGCLSKLKLDTIDNFGNNNICHARGCDKDADCEVFIAKFEEERSYAV